MSQILVVDSEAHIRQSLRELLEQHGYSVVEARSFDEVGERRDLQSFAVIISELRLPGGLGTDLIQLAAPTPVIISSQSPSIAAAVDAIKLGAADFQPKPFDHDEMLLCISRVQKEQQLIRQNLALRSELSRDYPVSGMIGSCPAMLALFEQIRKVAPTESTVLIQGESGTGKELAARALHQGSSRSDAPMISLNCAAIPDSLLESELFGYEKGAFTGASAPRSGLLEAADGGTLFLDEVGELPMAAQARLLRVLQEGEIRRVGSVETRRVNVRLIAATHRDLKAATANGAFRQDLFYRLNVVTLALPPLRERGDDILDLSQTLLERTCQKLNKPRLTLSGEALRTIQSYHWPGNVRELENAIARAVILCDTQIIDPELLAIDLSLASSQDPIEATSRRAQPISLEEHFVNIVLDYQDEMTETELAEKLGISRKSLWERRQRLNIPRKKTRTRRART
ncbi:MAG: sigma-54 dependent transcriptional regulator [Gammaproteobacteria bacterium]|jgi:DNA-binding NtrC family response regulator|nr:sigma-54 dependent transcriptional regulator [Gammaproteobacteria bacterium]